MFSDITVKICISHYFIEELYEFQNSQLERVICEWGYNAMGIIWEYFVKKSLTFGVRTLR